jgi:hypothetical protein
VQRDEIWPMAPTQLNWRPEAHGRLEGLVDRCGATQPSLVTKPARLARPRRAPCASGMVTTHSMPEVAWHTSAAWAMTCSSSSGSSTSMGWVMRQTRRGRRELTREVSRRGGGGFGVGAVVPNGGGRLVVASDNPRYSFSSRSCWGVRGHPPIGWRTSTGRAHRGGEMAATFSSNSVR